MELFYLHFASQCVFGKAIAEPFNVIKVCLMSLRYVFRVSYMRVSVMHWRIAVGVYTFCKMLFVRRKLVFPAFLCVLNFAFQMFVGIYTSILKTFKKSLKNATICFNHVGSCYFLFHGIYLLILFGDIELNRGPKEAKYLSFCHWKLNSVAAQDFGKSSTLKDFNTTKNFDFMFIRVLPRFNYFVR